MKGYIGTYNSPQGKGIYTFDYENNQLSNAQSLYPVDEGKCVYLFNKDYLIITLQEQNHAGIGILDLKTKEIIASHLEEVATPCFVYNKGSKIYTANYHDGVVMVYDFQDKLVLEQKITVQPKAGCHQVILYDDYLMVPCLLMDELRFYKLEGASYKLVQTIKYDLGVGPRHGIFNKDKSIFYLLSELSNELFIYQVQGLDFTIIKRIPLLNPETKGASSAALRLNSTENRLYLSTRGADLITVVNTETEEIMQQVNCGGSHPRDFILADDDHLLVVNKDSDDLVAWLLDEQGKLASIINKVSVPHGIGIVLAE